MAYQVAPFEIPLLRHVTTALEQSPASQVLYDIGEIVDLLAPCARIFNASPMSATNTQAEVERTVLIHKFKTQVTAFVSDDDNNKRMVAISLIKAAVETGGVKAFQTELRFWLKGLLSIVQGDADGAKQLAIIALTRVIQLSQTHPDVFREIITPKLPDFIVGCVGLLKLCQEPWLLRVSTFTFDAITGCLCSLARHHPTQIRPHSVTIQKLLVPWLIPANPTDVEARFALTPGVCANARTLWVVLHFAPRTAGSVMWAESIQALLTSFHHTADLVLRAVIEQWVPIGEVPKVRSRMVGSSTEYVQELSEGPFFLPPWRGITQGVKRLRGLLLLLDTFVITKTPMPVTVPISDIYDALNRLLSTIPLYKEQEHLNPEIDRAEREALFTQLPNIHVLVFKVLSTMAATFKSDVVPAILGLLPNIVWVFERQEDFQTLREATYTLVAELLTVVGHSMDKEDIAALLPIFAACTDDLLGGYAAYGQRIPGPAAQRLHPIILRFSQHIGPQIRIKLDRFAIQAQSLEALLASVTHVSDVPSVLPVLSQQFPTSDSVEALVRPQMPVIARPASVSGAETDTNSAFLTSSTPMSSPGNAGDGPMAAILVSAPSVTRSPPASSPTVAGVSTPSLPSQPADVVAPVTQESLIADDAGSDDSEFVMPALDMGSPSGDDEGEEED